MSGNKKRVLIIGGGWAGLSLAKILESDETIDLTVVDARDGFMLHKFAALRTSVQAGSWLDKVMVPTKQTLKNGKIIKGKVVKVNDMDKTAILENGDTIQFDVVVVSTGARNLSPGEPPASVCSVAGTKNYYTNMSTTIADAKNILVYGAGIVGIELCGEITSRYPEKMVTLVNGKNHNLGGVNQLSKGQARAITNLLVTGNMKYINNDDVVSPQIPKENLSNASPILEVTEKRVKLASGRMIDADIVILCFGGRLSTFGIFPNGWLSIQTGEIKIDPETFQVENCDFAYSFGDVATVGHEKLGSIHRDDAQIVAANVRATLIGKKPVRKAPLNRALLAVTFGESNGKLLLKGLPILSGWFIRSVKSRDLFTSYVWGLYAGGLLPNKYKWGSDAD